MEKLNKNDVRLLRHLAFEIKLFEERKLARLLNQFILGIAYGLGASLGAAVIVSILLFVYRNLLQGIVQRFF